MVKVITFRGEKFQLGIDFSLSSNGSCSLNVGIFSANYGLKKFIDAQTGMIDIKEGLFGVLNPGKGETATDRSTFNYYNAKF